MKRFFPSLVGVTSVILISGCSNAPPPMAPPSTIDVKVAVPITHRIVEWDEYTARLEPIEFVEVRARVGGFLQSIHFKEGQIVKKGDLLCVIDPRPYTAELHRSEAALAEAQARETEAKSMLAQAEADKKEAVAQEVLEQKRMKRAEQLLAEKAISKEDYDTRESALVQASASVESSGSRIESAKSAIVAATAAIGTAEAAVESAKLNLTYTEVRSPVTGRVSKRVVTEGNLVSGGTAESTLLTTIVSLDPIHCYFDADESAFLKYQRLAQSGKRGSSRDVKNPVFVALADEKPDFPHKGHMDFVDNRLDPNTGTMRGRAILRNTDLSLTPGLFARLRLPGSASYEAILIPDLSISSDQSVKFVYVVEDNGTIRRQEIKIGPTVHGLRVVREGLKGTEKIITQGTQRVRPGLTAKPTLEKIELRQDDGLPDDYQPVPESEWIKRDSTSNLMLKRLDASAGLVERTPLRQPVALQPPLINAVAPGE
ncbi:efflux RND transporter periplasmic adaptor subunit [bacterium]|nr:efflux RND transporter periplasmic adaptor subunit [bacterium]